MAGSYDGSIRIDTAINAAPIDNGLAQIENKIKGLAATIGLAFGVKELIDFGKRSIDAASDLAEAQNVVDTAFGAMSYKMEQFAATALETYGISELTAKNMGSTYMAMAKGMGVATDAASDMAVTLTGRLSDIMSFYNKTQSEVDTIGRALITGETEPLKAIGVVMTQTNLSAYAMAQGFSKTYAEMSSNEQLLVRYKYFLEQTALAQDDFAKTSEGWANQTRLLSERLNEFTTNLGGVIMNVLTPALQFANEAVTFLNDLFFGGKTEEETTAAKNAEAVTDEVTAVGTAADKSKKKLNNLLSGFDELHIISGAKSDDDENITDAGIDTSNLLGVNLDADTSTAKKAAQKYRDIINEIYLAFKRHPLTKAIEGIIRDIGKFFGFIKGNNDISAGEIVDALMDILGAIIAYKTVKGIVGGVNAFSKGFNGLIGVITAHPTAAAVAGITALAIGILALNDEMQRQNIASYFGDISISLDEVRTLISPITESVDKVAGAFEDNKTKLTTAKENFSDIAKAVQETADSFKKNDIEQDVEGFATQLDELVNSALEVNGATFDTSAWQIAFLENDGKIDEHEQEILDSFTEMGESIADKIKGYGKAIHLITQTAIDESRELTQAEIENLEDLYKKLAEMTLVQTQVESEATWERLKRGAYSIDSYEELAAQIKEAQEQEKKARDELQQSMYKDTLAKLGSERAAGEITDEEYEKQKADLFKEADDTVKELEVKSARYQREILSIWANTAFDKIVDANQGYSAENKKKVKEVFDLMLNAPDGVRPADILNRVDGQYAMNLTKMVGYNLDELNRQFGVDFMYEWRNLNEVIGDTGGSVDEFYDSLDYLLKHTEGLEVDNLLSKMEELKDRPKEYIEGFKEWLDKTNFDPIKIPIEFDSEEADKWIDEYIAKYNSGGNGVPQRSLAPTSSSYASQAPYAAGMQPVQQEFTFPIVIDGVTTETVKTNTETVLRPDWHNYMMDNGAGR